MDSLVVLQNGVKRYLESKCMRTVDEWIEGFVEHLSSTQAINQLEFNKLAYEQWLLNDLKDICPGSLPPDLSSKSKIVLPGKYVLQCNCALDIGTAAYQQLQVLRKVNVENVEATRKPDDKISSHRMIKLHLTDGVQDLTAIEYRPMRNLSCDMTPGSKILIKGPVTCRRGMLLLEERNCEVLGGEAGEDLIASNSLASLLSQKLGCDLNIQPSVNNINIQPNPNIQQLSIELSRNTNPYEESNRHNIPQQRPTSCTTQNQPTSSTNQNRLAHSPQLICNQTKPIARVTSIQISGNDFDDDDIDLEQLAELENQIYNTTNAKRNSNSENEIPAKRTKPDNLSCQTEERLNRENPANKTQIETLSCHNSKIERLKNSENEMAARRMKQDYLSSHNSKMERFKKDSGVPNLSRSDEFPDFDDELILVEPRLESKNTTNKMPLTSHNSKIECLKDRGVPNLSRSDEFPDFDDELIPIDEFVCDLENEHIPRTVSAEPFVCIKQLNELNTNEKEGKKFYIKAQILKLLSKLTIGKAGWSLRCTLIDGTGYLDADFTSEVLKKIVGLAPEEIKNINKKDVIKKPQLREKFMQALEQAKEALQVLNCIIELTFEEGPKITSLIDSS